MNLDAISDVFRLVDRDAWVVTAAHAGHRGGLIATWVFQASIDPENPVLVAGIAPNHYTRELIDGSGAFAAHLIAENQLDVAWEFANHSGRAHDKFAHIAAQPGETGSTILEDCIAYVEARVIAQYDAGDRIFYWADVVAGRKLKDGASLTEQRLMSSANPEQQRQALSGRNHDIAIGRPLRRQWIGKAQG